MAAEAGNIAEGRSFARHLLLAAAAMLVLAVVLWTYYGGAVFMSVMATAWSYCF